MDYVGYGERALKWSQRIRALWGERRRVRWPIPVEREAPSVIRIAWRNPLAPPPELSARFSNVPSDRAELVIQNDGDCPVELAGRGTIVDNFAPHPYPQIHQSVDLSWQKISDAAIGVPSVLVPPGDAASIRLATAVRFDDDEQRAGLVLTMMTRDGSGEASWIVGDWSRRGKEQPPHAVIDVDVKCRPAPRDALRLRIKLQATSDGQVLIERQPR